MSTKTKVIDKYYSDNKCMSKRFLTPNIHKIIMNHSEATPDDIASLLIHSSMYNSNGNEFRDKKRLKHKLVYYRNSPEESITFTDRSLILIDVLIDKLKNLVNKNKRLEEKVEELISTISQP